MKPHRNKGRRVMVRWWETHMASDRAVTTPKSTGKETRVHTRIHARTQHSTEQSIAHLVLGEFDGAVEGGKGGVVHIEKRHVQLIVLTNGNLLAPTTADDDNNQQNQQQRAAAATSCNGHDARAGRGLLDGNCWRDGAAG